MRGLTVNIGGVQHVVLDSGRDETVDFVRLGKEHRPSDKCGEIIRKVA